MMMNLQSKLPFPYIVDHIPSNSPKRPNLTMDWEYITIHNTGNEHSTAKNERGWLTNSSNNSSTGWHIVVDEHGAIEAIPFNRVAYHAGDGGNGAGNRKSIGIELCESGNREKTIANAVLLVVALLKSKNKGINAIRQHYDWSKKNCPRILRANNGRGWDRFITDVEKELLKSKVVQEMSKYFKDVPKEHWGAESLDWMHERGLVAGKEPGKFYPNDNLTRIEAVALIDRAINFVLQEVKK